MRAAAHTLFRVILTLSCAPLSLRVSRISPSRSLELYARIKGLAEADVPGVVQAAIAQMDLGAFANKLAQSLSGGNKRKLSVAIALIGDVSFPPLRCLARAPHLPSL